MTSSIFNVDYLRVTDIIAPFTGIEFIPSIYLDPASERGTLVHQAIEYFLRHDVADSLGNREISGYLDSFLSFYDEYLDYFDRELILEKRFYCDEHNFTGQVDCILEYDGKIHIFDWKSSSKKQKSWAIQGAAYRYLVGLDYPYDIIVHFVHLKKDGKPAKIYTYENLEEEREIFFKCLDVYRWFEINKQKRKMS